MKRGQIVFSKAGRDKGLAMVVLEVQGDFLSLVDGRTRTLSKPKRKKIKHVQPTNYIVEMTPDCGRGLQDADIRKQLQPYCRTACGTATGAARDSGAASEEA